MPKEDRYVIPEGAERPKKKYLKKYLPEDRPLNRREQLFVKELVSKDGQITMRDAAINAGYPPKSAHVRAHELTNPDLKPHVVKAIKQYRAELDQKYGVEYKRHLRDLQVIRDAALENGAYSAAVQAEYRRGQAQGDIYVSKAEVRHGTIDSMSKEEVLNAIKELKQTYDPVTIDITPTEEAHKNREKTRSRIMGTVQNESEGAEAVLDDGED